MQRGVPLLILPFISQVMEPVEYGAASMLTASSLVLTTVLAGPLEALVFRAAARSDDDSPALLRVMAAYCYLVMPMVLAAIASVIALVVPTLIGVSGQLWAIQLLAVGFLPAMTYFALPVVQARQNLSVYAWLALTSSLLAAGSKLVLVLGFKLGVLGWVVSDLITAVVSAVLAVILVRPPRAAVTAKNIRSVASFAVPLIPHRTSAWVMSYASRPLMAIVSSMAQVGLLSLGLNLASVVTLLLAEINRAVMPQYSRESFPAPTAMTRGIAGFQLVLSFVVPAMIGAGLALFGKWVFPAAYWPAFALTGVLLVGQVAVGLYCIPANYLIQAAGATKAVGLASTIGAAVQIVFLLTLGKTYGATGAAYATVAGFVAMTVVASALPRFLKLDIAWRTWLRYWPQTALGVAALVASVAALLSPVGSNQAHLLAFISLAPALAALVTSRYAHLR
jgi:O-antigen/teichoic acid export membrane protein